MTTQLWMPAASDRYTPGRGAVVDTLVFHTTTTTFDAAVRIFQTGSRMVSAHFVVDEYEDRVAKCVDEEDTAWHAGNWPINQRSIGIEHVDNGDWWGARPDDLYERSIALCLDIMKRHPITTFLRHSQCSPTACPDGLDTARLVGGIQMPTGYLAIEENVKATIRAVMLNEPQLTATALRKFLVGAKATPKRTKKVPSRAAVRAGHGKGRS